MSVKTKSIGIVCLFAVLIIILAVNPKVVNNLYSYILGRLFLVCVVIFFSINNVTLGLLSALAVITALNLFGSFVQEGMENQIPTTVGEDNIDNTEGQTVLTNSATEAAKKKISDLKQSIADGTIGIDKEDIKAAIMSKDSKTIPLSKNMTNSDDDVQPSTSAMLDSSKSTLEGFSSYVTVY